MKLWVTGKLFLGIFATSILVALAMSWAFRYSLTMGFADYVRQSDSQRAENIAEALSETYEETGSWVFLRKNPSILWRLTRPAGHPLITAPQNAEQNNSSAAPTPTKHRGDDDIRRNPMRRLLTRLWITDTNNKIIFGAGSPPQEAKATAIKVQEKTVGWVKSAPPPFLSQAPDARFVKQQSRATWAIAGLSAILAALVSVLLARLFLAPIKRLAAATHELSAGNYHVQVPVTSQDEIGQLAQDFNLLANTLEKNEGLRRNFMADVSHELRTPLAVLRGELEALQDGVRQPTIETLSSLQAEVATLSKLVDDVYQLSLTDLGALTYRKMNVNIFVLLQQAVSLFRERFHSKQLTLEISLPEQGEIFGDPDRLMQLFNNLLENSLRYTDAQGMLRISSRQDEQTIYLDFQDSAPCVPAQALPKLFERLFRVDPSRSRASGGSGLGLTICLNIVRAHDGVLTARPSPLGGLWLEVSLPRVRKFSQNALAL